MTRTEALEALEQAVRDMARRYGVSGAVAECLSRIDALPPAPAAGEVRTVEVRAWVRSNNNDPSLYIVEGAGSWDGKWCQQPPPRALATLTARVPLPEVPTIPATVTLHLAQEGEG